jgi:uncharacterized membrane protein
MGFMLILTTGSALLVIALAIPMIRRKVKPNPYYGFRTPRLLKNPDLWYDANAYAGRWLVVYGLGVLVASIGLALVPNISPDTYAIAVTGVALGGLGLLCLLLWRYLRNAPQ